MKRYGVHTCTQSCHIRACTSHSINRSIIHTQFTPDNGCNEQAERPASLGINMSSVKIYSWQFHQLKHHRFKKQLVYPDYHYYPNPAIIRLSTLQPHSTALHRACKSILYTVQEQQYAYHSSF